MKILFVTEYYPPAIKGGAEISLNILVQNLVRKKKYEITIITPNYESFTTHIKTDEKNELKIIKFKSLRYFLLKKKENLKTYKNANEPIKYILTDTYINYSAWELKRKSEKILKEEKFDIIHANNLESILALSFLKTSAKKIAHLRDFGLFCFNRGLNNRGKLCTGCSFKNLKMCMNAGKLTSKFLIHQINRRKVSIRSFDLFISISEFVKSQYVNKLQIDKEKIKVLYNPISSDIISKLSKQEARKKLSLPLNKKIILFVGTLSRNKGAHLIPKIAKRVGNKYLFIVIGKGELESMFAYKKIKNIAYLGYLPISKIKDYYKAADILLVPSLWYEPFGRVIIEGAINGCLIIGSNRGGIPEIIDKLKVGKYVNPTVDNFVDAIKNSEKIEISQTSIKRRLTEFLDEAFVKKFENIIAKC